MGLMGPIRGGADLSVFFKDDDTDTDLKRLSRSRERKILSNSSLTAHSQSTIRSWMLPYSRLTCKIRSRLEERLELLPPTMLLLPEIAQN